MEDIVEQGAIDALVDELSQDLGTPADGKVRLPAFKPTEGQAIAVSGREYLKQMRQVIRKAHDLGAPSRPVERAFAEALDNVLKTVFEAAMTDVGGKRKTPPAITLVPVGGYGRGELAPFSDVDVLFLYSGRTAASAKKVSDQVLYALWDLGLDVGYSVRTVSDCMAFADEDDTVRTAMLDARFLCGNRTLWEDFQRDVSQKALLKRPDRYLETKIDNLERRHTKAGESVYILEPDVKEGRGGIRDFQTVLWAARVKFKTSEMETLHQLGFLNRKELAQFNRYFDFLLRVRHELHFQAGSKTDRLQFDLQEKVAPGMGFSAEESAARAAERFMRRYYLVTRASAQLTSVILERMKQYGKDRPRLMRGWRRTKDVGDGFKVVGNELTVEDPELFVREPHKMMLIFERSQDINVEISDKAKELIYLNRHRAAKAFLEDQRVHASFRKIIQSKRRVFRTLWVMHDLRLLTQYMPEFRTITCHVQHDAYHLHTTDIHTLFAVREIRQIMRGEKEELLPLATSMSQQTERPHVLYLGILFHDVGKNMGGNHSVKGAERARAICERMGLPEKDVADVEWLVAQHLLLSHIALKRDLNDPRQISAFASQVGSQERLEMLYLLTIADMRAVGPDIWTPWKGALCDEAFRTTEYALEHGRIENADMEELARRRTEEAVTSLKNIYPEELLRRELALFPGRYFLASSVERIRRHLHVILSEGEFHPEQPPPEGDAHKDFSNIPLRIAYEQIEGTPYFEIVVYSLDVPRFFSNVAGVFASHGLSILSAEITTLRDGTLLDVFHVSDPFGHFNNDPERWTRLQQHLTQVIQGRVKVDKLLGQTSTPLGIARFSSKYPTKISFDNESSRKCTIVDVTTGDRIGLLHRITGALADVGATITLAKVSTKKERADDTFYVTDIFGHKIRDPQKLSRLETRLREAIGGTALDGEGAPAAPKATVG